MKWYHTFFLSILMFSCERENEIVCIDSENAKNFQDGPIPVKDGLKGNWKLIDIDYSEYYSTLSEETRMRLQPELDAQMKDMVGKTAYDFQSIDMLVIQMPADHGDTSIQANYQISKNADSIYFFFSEEKEAYRVDAMTKKQMILKTSELPARRLIFSRLN